MSAQCRAKENGPQPRLLFVSMFTVPTALLCFDNLSSQNSRRKSYLVGLHKCMRVRTHTGTHTQTGRQSDGWRKSQTSIRGAESSWRRTKGCNGCGPPQTGHQRKPRHGSEARGAYQISLESSLRRWHPPRLYVGSLTALHESILLSRLNGKRSRWLLGAEWAHAHILVKCRCEESKL